MNPMTDITNPMSVYNSDSNNSTTQTPVHPNALVEPDGTDMLWMLFSIILTIVILTIVQRRKGR